MNIRHGRFLLQELSILREEGRHTDFTLVCGDVCTKCHKVVLATFSRKLSDICVWSSSLETEYNSEYLINKLYSWTDVGPENLKDKMARSAEELGVEFLVKSGQIAGPGRLEILRRARLRVFAEQMDELWRTKLLTDVALGVGGSEFRCHKAVLAAMSSYFDAMFSSGMRETEEGAIELHGLDEVVIENILEYIYTGKIDINNENADLIFSASVYLQIKPLQSICERFLLSHTDLDNCVDVLHLANSNSCNDLANNVIGFIKENITQIIDKKSFESIDSDTFIQLIASDDLIVPGETDVLDLALQWFEKQDQESEETLTSILQHVRCSQIPREHLQRLCDNNPTLKRYPACQRKLLEGNGGTDSFRNDKVLLVVRPCHFSDDVDVVCYSFTQSAWFTLDKFVDFNPGGGPGVCFYNNCIYISGGSGNLMHFGKYDCHKNNWTYLKKMNVRRFSHCMCGVGENIYVIGGKSKPNDVFNTIQKYSTTKESWSKEGELLVSVSEASCACVESRILVFGGSGSVFNFTHLVQCYDLKTKTCSEIASFPKGVLTGIMRVCAAEEYFYHVTAEGKVLRSSRTDPWDSQPELIGVIKKGLMMPAYSVVYHKGGLLLVSDTKSPQGDCKVIRYGISDNRRLQCNIKLPFVAESNQYSAAITNISRRHLVDPAH